MAERAARSHCADRMVIDRSIARRYWLNFNEFEGQLAEFCDTREALLARTEHMRQHLEKLKHTNPYNDTFHIWHDGHYGTINGLRLGRLHIQAVRGTLSLSCSLHC